jgi:hypothetical protein
MHCFLFRIAFEKKASSHNMLAKKKAKVQMSSYFVEQGHLDVEK